jgi:D-aminopeptidase
MMLAS